MKKYLSKKSLDSSAKTNDIKVNWIMYFTMKNNGSETKGVTENSSYLATIQHV
jgi:hypothetical protein